MFLVFNKEKIYTYLVSIVTVILLFCMANVFQNSNMETVETSTNSEKLLPIYNVQIEENKVSLTMNCAWSQ